MTDLTQRSAKELTCVKVRGLAPGIYRVLVRYKGKEFRSPDVTVKARVTASTQIRVR